MTNSSASQGAQEKKQEATDTEVDAALKSALELQRLLGDPRVRVEVPTSHGPDEPTPFPASRRYHVG